MNQTQFEVRQCTNPACNLRYTRLQNETQGRRCPKCRSEASLVGELFTQNEIPRKNWHSNGVHFEIMIDNIRSAWNVGSIFRISDGAGIHHLHLCGITPQPDNYKVAKTALGAQNSVSWTYHPDGLLFCQEALQTGYHLWALEGGEKAISLYDAEFTDNRPILLVVGNELTGVDPGIMEICEQIVCLPMMGVKGSLNVAVAFGAAAYHLRFGLLNIGI
jgi:23S rRNA (guanosine2251-2'-O)-methyltransferase